MSTHTPGPWTAEPKAKRGAWIKGSTGEWSALACGDTDASANANARLIAAAPELLAALECQEAIDHRSEAGFDVLKRHGWNSPGNEHLSFEDFVRKLRRAAIAKATGAQP